MGSLISSPLGSKPIVLLADGTLERGCVRSASRNIPSLSNPLRLGLRPLPRSAGSLLPDRPHPGPLPQERENPSPVSHIADPCRYSARAPAINRETPIAAASSESASTARSLFPLPGGEGQGEGERHTNCSDISGNSAFTTGRNANAGAGMRAIIRYTHTARSF